MKEMFVYGSLMDGFWNYEAALEGHIASRQKVYVKGKLYHVPYKNFPALTSGDDWVEGELFQVKDYEQLEPKLNEIEGITGEHAQNEYELKRILIYDENKKPLHEVEYYSYVVDNDVRFKDEAIYIASGSWREYMEIDN